MDLVFFSALKKRLGFTANRRQEIVCVCFFGYVNANNKISSSANDPLTSYDIIVWNPNLG